MRRADILLRQPMVPIVLRLEVTFVVNGEAIENDMTLPGPLTG